jgi:hypothetical protein
MTSSRISSASDLGFAPGSRGVLSRLGVPAACADAALREEVRHAVEEVGRVAAPALEYLESDLAEGGRGEILAGGVLFRSEDLACRLRGCSRATLFALTLGDALDRAVEALSGKPSRQVILDAAGSEAAEALARSFQRFVAARAGASGMRALPRYSPGYGDLGLENQSWFVETFGGVGLRLSPGGMLVPLKSVTGVIGWKAS